MASASAEPCVPSKANRWPGLTRATGEANGVEALSGIGTAGWRTRAHGKAAAGTKDLL
ncbi:hypothetical protein FEP76_04810 [Burkholderia multivorans]|nr:hypothetical protein [Burkholderia multivorans]